MESLFEFLPRPARGSKIPKSEHLYRELRAAIVEGRLAPGVRLPATRNAEKHFKLSRNTVARVYERLTSEGFIDTRAGAGSYVAVLKQAMVRKRGASLPIADARLNPVWTSGDLARSIHFWQEDPLAFSSTWRRVIDFRPALIDSELFPHQALRRLVPAQLRSMERRPAASKSPQGNAGHFPLRAAVARHIGTTRAIAAAPEEVLITAGAQQAFDLIARILVRPGKSLVAFEEPGYPPMRAAFLAAGALVHPAQLDAEGLIVASLPPGLCAICVCPSHQFPLGLTMSPRRRQELLAYARANNAVIVEDDYDGEFRLEGDLVEALRSDDSSDLVFYVGTFSKCMLPSLRLGYLVAPSWAKDALIAAKNSLDWHCPVLTQGLVASFMSEGHLVRHIKKMRLEYRKRRDAILHRLDQPGLSKLHPIKSSYGLHISATLDHHVDLEKVARQLHEDGIELHTLDRYFYGPTTLRGFVFGFGATHLAQIDVGMTALEHCFKRAGV